MKKTNITKKSSLSAKSPRVTKTTRSKTVAKKTVSKVPKRSLAHHVAKSLVSVAPHAHTGHAIHRRHTSHGVLLVALLLTGVLLFSNLGALKAYGLTTSASQTIAVTVTGDPPTVGADIIYPTDNTSTKSPQIQVRGTCEAGTLVATYNNGTFVGSSQCANDGTYATTIQLIVGTNVLQSQNYDAANQPGPVTAQVTIIREADPVVVNPVDPVTPVTPNPSTTTPVTDTPEVATKPEDITPTPTPIVTEPAPQPAENPCYDSSKSTGLDPGTPTIIANCITRSVATGQTVTLPIRVTGGVTPYKLSINWGDGVTDLKSVLDTEYHNYTHTYQTAGIISVGLKTTDSKGVSSFLQTVVQVNGTPGVAGATNNTTSPIVTIKNTIQSLWTKAPLPLYFAALTLLLGFIVGDVIERIFDKTGKHTKTTKGSGRRKPPTQNFNQHRHA